MRIRADLHIHSVVSDGNSHPCDIVRYAKLRNLDVISITDHDSLLGSIRARKCSEELLVLYGAEIRSSIGDILVICPQPLNDLVKEIGKLIDSARREGCLLIPAHPFDIFRLGIGLRVRDFRWDAIEVFNASSDPISNLVAYVHAKRSGARPVANSDAHILEHVGVAYTTFECSNFNEDEVFECIRKSNNVELHMGYGIRYIPKRVAWSLRRMGLLGSKSKGK